jgi:hypothetical protein
LRKDSPVWLLESRKNLKKEFWIIFLIWFPKD